MRSSAPCVYTETYSEERKELQKANPSVSFNTLAEDTVTLRQIRRQFVFQATSTVREIRRQVCLGSFAKDSVSQFSVFLIKIFFQRGRF